MADKDRPAPPHSAIPACAEFIEESPPDRSRKTTIPLQSLCVTLPFDVALQFVRSLVALRLKPDRMDAFLKRVSFLASTGQRALSRRPFRPPRIARPRRRKGPAPAPRSLNGEAPRRENLRGNFKHQANGIDVGFVHYGLSMSDVPSGSLVEQRPRPPKPTSLRASAANSELAPQPSWDRVARSSRGDGVRATSRAHRRGRNEEPP